MIFACANCRREWDEPFCEMCGASLMPRGKHLSVVEAEQSPWLRLLNETARDNWSRRV